MSKINQPDDQDNWPDATRVYSTTYDARTALMDAVSAQKASDLLPDITAFNMGLNAWHQEETKIQLSEFTDSEIKAEYDKRFPF